MKINKNEKSKQKNEWSDLSKKKKNNNNTLNKNSDIINTFKVK